MFNLICQYCKEKFISQWDSTKFCSWDCYQKNREAKRIQEVCLVCGKSFYTKPCYKGTTKYCSMKCFYKARRIEKIKRVCKTCGKSFEILPTGLKDNRGNYCSISCAAKNKIPWNKGLTKETDSRVRQYIENSVKSRKGKPLSEKQIRANQIRKIGKKANEEAKKNYRLAAQKRCQNPQYWENLRASLDLRPNKKENRLNQILESILPGEYRYVGDFSFILGGKNPDFMNVNGQKKLVELWGTYWHRNDEPQDRIDFFKQFGFHTLIVWENELNNRSKLVSRLLQFNKEKEEVCHDV